MNTSGRRAFGFVVESLDGSKQLPLPTVIECDHLPNDRSSDGDGFWTAPYHFSVIGNGFQATEHRLLNGP
jgi:hypothetical protein